MSSPVLPYRGTSGHSGTDTSESRARHFDKGGKTAWMQTQVLNMLKEQSVNGVTWLDVAEALEVHHGTASGTLSVLHKAGKITRLKETRNGSKVYVLPHDTDGRRVEPPKQSKIEKPKAHKGFQSMVSFDGGEILVTHWNNGKLTLCFREFPSDSWSEPVLPTHTTSITT